MMTDWKALCAELLGELENEGHAHWPGGPDGDPLIEQTRAALAAEADGPAVPEGREPASVVGEPSDEELLRIAAEAIDPYDKIGLGEYEAETERAVEAYGSELIAFARAVLARYSHQPAPPAEDPTLRDAALLALTTLEGWSNYDQWVWPISAMEQAKRGTTEALASLKQALSHQPTPPAEGEVAELVKTLRELAYPVIVGSGCAVKLRRAADLLERLASPACVVLRPSPELIEAFKDALPGRIEPLPDDAQVIEPATHTILVPAPAPVPVAERLPGPEDCDGEGRAWFLSFPFEYSRMIWSLEDRTYGCNTGFTHWLPATALPLPQGELQP